jgi:hypothetical protein
MREEQVSKRSNRRSTSVFGERDTASLSANQPVTRIFRAAPVLIEP